MSKATPPPFMPEEYDLFVTTFIGEMVRIVTKSNLTIGGVLLDSDGTYYYLGDNPDEVAQAIKVEDVSIIQIEKQADSYSELLSGMPDRNDKNTN